MLSEIPCLSISGFGYCLPERVVSNADIVSRINTSEEFIQERTGVMTRRHARAEQTLADFIVPAAKAAIAEANLSPQQIDLLLINSLSPDYHDPSQACLVQPLIGLGKIPAFDIRAQCSGFMYGLNIARGFLQAGLYKNILLVCAEILSKRMDCSDTGRNLSILLGDGAGAAVLTAAKGKSGLLDLILGADGDYFQLLSTQSPGSANSQFISSADLEDGRCHFRMRGAEMFEHASQTLIRIAQEMLLKHQLKVSDVNQVICHQPNLRILETVKQKLGLQDRQMLINVDQLGNMASASLPVTYAQAVEKEIIRSGDLVMLLAYGSGATWGSGLYRV